MLRVIRQYAAENSIRLIDLSRYAIKCRGRWQGANCGECQWQMHVGSGDRHARGRFKASDARRANEAGFCLKAHACHAFGIFNIDLLLEVDLD
jgi:hypothetical protein